MMVPVDLLASFEDKLLKSDGNLKKITNYYEYRSIIPIVLTFQERKVN